MKNLFVFVCLLMGFARCKSHQMHDDGRSIPISSEKLNNRKLVVDIFQCTTVRDTVFGDGNYIKYIPVDTMFRTEIKIGGLIDTLNFPFNCNTTNGLIPNIVQEKNNAFLFEQGFGFTFRNTIVCEKKGMKIECHSFEITKVYSGAPEVLVYKNVDSCSVKVFYRATKKIKSVRLPLAYCNSEIKLVEVYLRHAILKFSDKENLNIAL